ncbi:phosphotransferase family protein [Kineococcus sp. SYSU DK005]|uniref:phosphotransferase family protein n=1 Tax=Kineococcus sp. SYSU DK005 TaxID=3383126 RepID=UPI003D7D40C4
MEFSNLARPAGAFQQPVDADVVRAICRRAFGAGVRVLSAVELGGGMYNTTYRLQLAGREEPVQGPVDEPVVLRLAPREQHQFRSERHLMRAEHASAPWLAALAPLMPRVIAADFTHELIDRDWMLHSFLPGAPAMGPQGLIAYPRSAWAGFFRQLGAITKAVHAVRGAGFGPVLGPWHAKWSQALAAAFADIAADVQGVGLDAQDLRAVAALAEQRAGVLDEVGEPRLLAGDLWIANVLLAPGAAQPTITGVLDLDRTWWGDPAADWGIRMALAKPGTEREAFWDAEGYGALQDSRGARWRRGVYQARHLGAVRLEHHRLGDGEGVQRTYEQVRALLQDLR